MTSPKVLEILSLEYFSMMIKKFYRIHFFLSRTEAKQVEGFKILISLKIDIENKFLVNVNWVEKYFKF